MIITLISFKGGVGKTSTAIALAEYVQATYGPTLLIDGDPNRSALNWSRRGELPFAVCDQMSAAAKSRNYEHLIIDTAARPSRDDIESLSESADLLVLPTEPTALALDSLMQSIDLLTELGANYAIALTKIPPPPQTIGIEARETLTDMGLLVLPQGVRLYKAHQDAATFGIPVSQVKGGNAKIAARDVRTLAEQIVEKVPDAK